MTLMLSILALAASGGGELQPALRALRDSTGSEYVEAREVLRALGPAARRELEASPRAAWTRASWRDDWSVAVAQAWLRRGDELAAVYALPGLDPARYLQRRRPEPLAAPGLRRLVDAGPVLIELVLKTHAVYPPSPRERYPKDARPEQLAAWRTAEHDALLCGAIEALGASGHPAAAFALEEVLSAPGYDTLARAAAATALGATGHAEALTTLRRLATRDGEAISVRAAALQGAGRVRSEEAARFLSSFARATGDLALRPAAIRALGHLASSWAWRGSDAERGERVRELASRTLIGELLRDDAGAVEQHLLEALVTVQHPSAAAALEQALVDGRLPAATRARARQAIEQLALADKRR